jgi:hypothetical protein
MIREANAAAVARAFIATAGHLALRPPSPDRGDEAGESMRPWWREGG